MFTKNILLLGFFFLLVGCGAKVRNGGYSLREYQIEDLKKIKNKDEALQIAGSPSSKIEIFNDNKGQEIWLYSSYRSEQTAFLDPKYTNYDIAILYFNKSGNLEDLTIKKLDQDKFIAYSDARTEFPGKIQLKLISELFGHIGKVSALPGSNDGR